MQSARGQLFVTMVVHFSSRFRWCALGISCLLRGLFYVLVLDAESTRGENCLLRGLFYTSVIDAECVHWDQLFVTRVVLHICYRWRGRARDFAVSILYIIVLFHVDAEFCIDSEDVQWVSCLLRGLFCTSVTDSKGMQGVSFLLRGLFYTLVLDAKGVHGVSWLLRGLFYT